MSDDAIHTLFLPFEKDIVPVPAGPVLFMGAAPHPFLARLKNVSVIQNFYPLRAALPALKDADDTADGSYAASFCLLPKQKEEAQHDLAMAASKLKDGGLIAACAANDAGGTRIEGWMKELGLSPQTMPKNKARVCWAVKQGAGDGAKVQAWIAAGEKRALVIDGAEWTTQPGLFGWNRADTGSQLLLKYLPADLSGAGADFGCGYGYLSRPVLHRAGITKLTGIDADRRAVDCAAINGADARAHYIWADLSQPVKGVSGLDFIVMNPPFHEGKAAVPALGRAFIATAAASLKPGGVLYMVANAHLDYESVLKTHFPHGDKLAETGGFKVFRAVR